MLIKAELLKQEIPARLTENAALCRPWGENGLAVHFYDGDGRIEWSWWSDGKNSIKYLHNTQVWTTGLYPVFHWNRTKYKTDSESDGILRSWAKANGIYVSASYPADDLCNSFDRDCSWKRRQKAEKSKQERMEREFAAFPQRRDEAVQAWLDRRLPQYLIYSKQNRKHEREVCCTACGKRWTSAGRDIRRGERDNCPVCGQEGTYYPTFGKDIKTEQRSVWTAEREKATTWWRVTAYSRTVRMDGRKAWTAEDTLRVRETRNNAGKTERRAYVNGQWGWKCCRHNDVWERDAWVFPDTLGALGEAIGNTPVALIGKIARPVSLYHLTDALRRVVGAEYYAKCGLWRLLMDSYRSGVSIPVPPALRYLARTFDVRKSELDALEQYGAVPPDRFAVLRALHGGVFRRSKTELDMGTDTYIRHFTRWKEQNPKTLCSQIEQWYEDYIGMCRGQGVDLSRKEVRFPRDLKAEHDRLARRLEIAKGENANGVFAEVCARLYAPMHGYTDGKYTVVFPQLRTDLIAEGQSLHHCVGGDHYYQEHMKGVRMIFFIRRADEPGRPLYTLQADVQEGSILQLYGAHDKPAPKEAHAFCRAFLAQLWTGEKEKVQKCS